MHCLYFTDVSCWIVFTYNLSWIFIYIYLIKINNKIINKIYFIAYFYKIVHYFKQNTTRDRQVYFAFINLFLCLCTKTTHSLSYLALYSQIIFARSWPWWVMWRKNWKFQSKRLLKSILITYIWKSWNFCSLQVKYCKMYISQSENSKTKISKFVNLNHTTNEN